jgi:hypothetical protein
MKVKRAEIELAISAFAAFDHCRVIPAVTSNADPACFFCPQQVSNSRQGA